MSICCIGAGYVGGPTMAMIAAQCPDIPVTVVDVDRAASPPGIPDACRSTNPGCDAVVKAARGRNLFFSSDVDAGIRQADIVFVSVNTPTKSYGIGAGSAADLTNVELCARRIAAVAERRQDRGREIDAAGADGRIAQAGAARQRDGAQIRDPVEPGVSRGGNRHGGSRAPGSRADRRRQHGVGRSCDRSKLVDIYARWVPRERILTTNVWSSELSKLVSNALLAQRISSVNALSALCEATGADIDEVTSAAGRDSRIGSKFLKASVGFRRLLLSEGHPESGLPLPPLWTAGGRRTTGSRSWTSTTGRRPASSSG